MQAAFHLFTALGFFFFYHPKKRSDTPRLTLKQILWEIDPIGSVLFISAATLLLLAFDLAGGAYTWSDPHVAAPLGIGFGLFVLFGLYEWKGETTASSHTSSSRDLPTSRCRASPSLLKDGFSTVL